MPEKYRFRFQTILDLPTYREFFQLSYYTSSINMILRIVSVLMAWLLAFLFRNSYPRFSLIFYPAIFLFSFAAVHFSGRKGGPGYRRMLVANAGQPQQSTTFFCEDGIFEYNQYGAQTVAVSYEDVRSIAENDTLYLLVLPHNLAITVCKDSVTSDLGGDPISFLLWRCTKLKHRKVRTETPGKVLHWGAAAMMILMLIMGIFNISPFRQLEIPGQQLRNDLSYQQIAAQLAPLGITVSDSTIAELEEYDRDYAAEYGEDYYAYGGSKAADLLYWEGYGLYDEETWKWTPSTSGVYTFDTEVWNVESIYTDFLTGLKAMDPELNFTNIREDYSQANLEEGTGTIAVSFDWKGKHYDLTADYFYDWFDSDFLKEMGNIIATEGGQELFVHYDGQCCLLYYGTREQLRQLESMIGLRFDPANSPFLFY